MASKETVRYKPYDYCHTLETSIIVMKKMCIFEFHFIVMSLSVHNAQFLRSPFTTVTPTPRIMKKTASVCLGAVKECCIQMT